MFPWFSSMLCLLELECPGGLLTLMSGPWAGMVGRAGSGQSLLCVSMQPFHMARLGFLKAWQSQGNQIRQLASPQAIILKLSGSCQSHKAWAWKQAQHHFHHVINQSSHRPTQIQGKGTQNHLAVRGVPSLIYYMPVLPPWKVARGPTSSLYSK